MTRFRSRRIIDLKESENRNMTSDHLLRFRFAKRNIVLHKAAERLQGFGPAAVRTRQFYCA